MAKPVSVGTMIRSLQGLIGTRDISEWEDEFIASIWEQSQEGTITSKLSEKQLNVIERLYGKHFA